MTKQTTLTYQIQRAAKGAGFEDQAPRFNVPADAQDVLRAERLKAEVKHSGEQFRLIETRTRVVG